MSSDTEIEGTQGEATWAMLTVIIIIVVVVIFCLLLPFYRALEKRWHHWDDPGNDPRWDVENFQFSPTSPQLNRDPKYNRLSTCSADNSSQRTSSSGINRGNSFRNTCVMPRFEDQVEFKLPPSYDDLFDEGYTEQSNRTPPPYSKTDTEQLIQEIEEKPSPTVKEAPPKKFYKKPKSKSSAAPPTVGTESVGDAKANQTLGAAQDNKPCKNPQVNSATKNKESEVKNKSINTKVNGDTNTTPSVPAKTKTKNIKSTSTPPAAPPPPLSQPAASPLKNTSKVISQVQNTNTTPPVAPAKKSYKKIKKTVPKVEETAKSDVA